MSEQVGTALKWIKEILESEQVPYQIVGGLAATIHGGTRDVADIDLYVPKHDVEKLLPYVDEFISKPLKHYVEEGWDLEYFQLIYRNQKIEIGLSPGTKVFDSANQSWVSLEIDYAHSVSVSYRGIEVPTMPILELIEYKSVLGREVDLIDITELKPFL